MLANLEITREKPKYISNDKIREFYMKVQDIEEVCTHFNVGVQKVRKATTDIRRELRRARNARILAYREQGMLGTDIAEIEGLSFGYVYRLLKAKRGKKMPESVYTSDQYNAGLSVCRLRSAAESMSRILPLFYFGIPASGPSGKEIMVFVCAQCGRESPFHELSCGVSMLEQAVLMYTNNLVEFAAEITEEVAISALEPESIIERTNFN